MLQVGRRIQQVVTNPHPALATRQAIIKIFLLICVITNVTASRRARQAILPDSVVQIRQHQQPLKQKPGRTAHIADLKPGDALELCDCTSNQTSKRGLMCEGDGFFVQSFTHQARWQKDNSSVPLNNAVCCRPCVPPPSPFFTTQDETGKHTITPAEVVSMGCHLSNNPAHQHMQCEDVGTNLVVGFPDSDVVKSSGVSNYFPIRGSACCAPQLIMSNGKPWQLHKCNCQPAENGRSCEGSQLLDGYPDYRLISTSGIAIPVNTPTCCQVCLGPSLVPDDACEDPQLHGCNQRGVCQWGVCQCLGASSGVNCSSPIPYFARSFAWPAWLMSVLMLTCVVLFFMLSGCVKVVYDHCGGAFNRWVLGTGLDTELREPLLRMHGNGSVGSRDTEVVSSVGDQQDGPPIEEGDKGGLKKPEGAGVLTDCFCSICWTQPVQVVLMPCGHSNLCRRCSRRLDVCPFCRTPVARRQRLYIAE